MKSLAAILCAITLAGCSSVTLKEPFPESKLTPEEQKELTGTWLLDETVCDVRFTSNGVPWMAGIEWKDDDFVVEKMRLYFAKRNDVLYFCMLVEPDKPDEYFFGEIRPDGDNAFVWGPDVDYFSARVKEGTLKGSVDKDKHSTSVTIESPAAEILELISTNHAAIDYRNPLVFKKLE